MTSYGMLYKEANTNILEAEISLVSDSNNYAVSNDIPLHSPLFVRNFVFSEIKKTPDM